jgi:type II secretory pathway predicted ATPase ExeA
LGILSVQDVRLISLTPLAGSRGRVATALARAIGDNDLILMLSGPEGSGKSAVLAAVVATLAYGGTRVIRVSNPDDTTMGQRELAARILGRPTMGSPAQLVAEAITNLLAGTDDDQVVLVVDDAHTLSDQALELLLVIASAVRRGMKAPQLLLAGRGDFWDRAWRDVLRVLTDMAEKFTLDPLTEDDARDIVMDEAKAAGGTVVDVTRDASTALVRSSFGLTSEMDRIVTAAVALGNTRRATVLTEEIVDAALSPDALVELRSISGSQEVLAAQTIAAPDPIVDRTFRPGWPAISAGALVVVAGLSVALVPAIRSALFGSSPPASTSPPTAGVPAPSGSNIVVQAGKIAAPAASSDANTSPVVAVSAKTTDFAPSVDVGSRIAPPAAQDPGHLAASVLVPSSQPPAASAPQPVAPRDHTDASAPPAEDSQSHGHLAALSDQSATETKPSAPLDNASEVKEPETPAATLPTPSVVATIAPTQPMAAPPIALLPTAPPPAASLPPPPAATPVVAPPVASPSSIPAPAAASISAILSPPVQPSSSSHTAQETTPLPTAVIVDLLQRGEDKLAAGDVLSARLYFERAGAAGSEEGELRAAKTYDPEYLATIDAPGLQPNINRAVDWYRIAATTHGNTVAQKRIDELTTAVVR